MRGFVGMNDGASGNTLAHDSGAIGLTLHDERQDAARALRQCDDDAAVAVLMLRAAAVYSNARTHRAMVPGGKPMTQAVLEKILENIEADREDVRRNETGILLSVSAEFA